MEDHGAPVVHSEGHWGPIDGSLKKAAACGEPMQEQTPGRTRGPMGNPHWSSLFLKDFTKWKGPMPEQFLKNWSLWERWKLEHFMKDISHG
ncbi:hypothetical protein BTVI_64522 [Pitangus sulphuratus]|nr:hypothetical protein BTVI_64522 [Pitangus sulphuratus]